MPPEGLLPPRMLRYCVNRAVESAAGEAER
jgi:hypothetical protein